MAGDLTRAGYQIFRLPDAVAPIELLLVPHLFSFSIQISFSIIHFIIVAHLIILSRLTAFA